MVVAQADPQEAERLEAEWLTSFPRFAEDHLKIQTVDGELVPLGLNPVQLLFDDVISDIKSQGRLVRIVVLKARREGISTYVSGRFYWKTTTAFNRYAMLITHEPEATEFIFDMHKRFYNHADLWKPAIRYNNKKILNFNTPDGKGLDSAIRVATAGKEDIGSSQLVHSLHLSEMAKWSQGVATPLLTSVLQCVPPSPDSEIIIESTAKGIGGEFHERFKGCRYIYEFKMDGGKPVFTCRVDESKPEYNAFSSVFIPWFVFPQYAMKVPDGFERTTKEQEMVDIYGLTDRQLVWRRWCIVNQCGGSEDIFKQEYPSNSEEAFISSGNPVWDSNMLIKILGTLGAPKVRYNFSETNGQWLADDAGKLWVYDEPRAGCEYVIGADVAEGNLNGDFSSADVIDVFTGKQVAHFHGHIPPDHYGILLYFLGRRYNTAWIAPERNAAGNTTVLKLADMRYSKLYVEKIPDPPNRPRKRYGWLTDWKSKALIVDHMSSLFRDGQHGIANPETVREMLGFKKIESGDRPKFDSESNMKNDRVMSYMIAQFIRFRLYATKMRMGMAGGGIIADAARDESALRKKQAPSIKAWTV